MALRLRLCRRRRRLRRGGKPEPHLVLSDGLLPPEKDFFGDFARFASKRETRGFDCKRGFERRHARIRGGAARQKGLRKERPADAPGHESQGPGAAVHFPVVGIDDVRRRRLAVACVNDDLPVLPKGFGRKRRTGGERVILRHHHRYG